MFSNLFYILQTEQTKIYTKVTEQKEVNVLESHGLSDRHEQTINKECRDGEISPVQRIETFMEQHVEGGIHTGVADSSLCTNIDGNSSESDRDANDHTPGPTDETYRRECGTGNIQKQTYRFERSTTCQCSSWAD